MTYTPYDGPENETDVPPPPEIQDQSFFSEGKMYWKHTRKSTPALPRASFSVAMSFDSVWVTGC